MNNSRYAVDRKTGILREILIDTDMGSPVRCTFCRRIYDLEAVTVIHRYADCTLWRTPCCNKQADDRRWKSRVDYEPIMRAADVNECDIWGRVYP